MKTILQYIIEKLEINAKEICPMDIDDILIWIEENEFVKQEKQQIIDAANQIEIIGKDHLLPGEEYYNKTYKDAIL